MLSVESGSHDRARRIGRVFVFLWFLIGGIAHFVATDTEVRLVPPFIPWPWAAVWVSGVFELLGAVGLRFTSISSVDAFVSAALLVRDVDGQYRPARADDEVLQRFWLQDRRAVGLRRADL